VPAQNSLHPQLVELARDLKIPLLATNDTHYTVPDQHDAHDLLLCIGTATNVDTPGRLKFETNEFFLKSPAEISDARLRRPCRRGSADSPRGWPDGSVRGGRDIQARGHRRLALRCEPRDECAVR
jgi:hypothetical protein